MARRSRLVQFAYIAFLVAALSTGIHSAAFDVAMADGFTPPANRTWSPPANHQVGVQPVDVQDSAQTVHAIDNVQQFIQKQVKKVVYILSDQRNGSGVLFKIRPEQFGYYVVTNAHVIDDYRQKIDIEFYNGCIIEDVPLLGRDYVSDLAILEIEKGDYCGEEYGYFLFPHSNRINRAPRVGEEVFAIGAALARDFSVTKGIVSAVDRTKSYYATMIQTDAAINFGNSGGSLIGTDGEFLGINTLTTRFPGINYAIDAATVFRIVPEMIDNRGRFERANLGIDFVDQKLRWTGTDEKERMRRHLGTKYGRVKISAFDRDILEDEQGGCDIREGDFIEEIDSRKTPNSLQARILANSIAVTSTKSIRFRKCNNYEGGDCDLVECSIRVPGFNEDEEQWQKRFWTVSGEDILNFLSELSENKIDSKHLPCLSEVKSIRTARRDLCGSSNDDSTTCGAVLEYPKNGEQCIALINGRKLEGDKSSVFVVDSISVKLYDEINVRLATLLGDVERELRPIARSDEIYDLDSFHWALQKMVRNTLVHVQKAKEVSSHGESDLYIVFPVYSFIGKERREDDTWNEVEVELISPYLWGLKENLRNYMSN